MYAWLYAGVSIKHAVALYHTMFKIIFSPVVDRTVRNLIIIKFITPF